MPTLATYENCTGCGACAFRCPKDCIEMKCNSIGVKIPMVDTTKCVECGACERACPAINEIKTEAPEKVYAAWNNDPEQRRTSASGGIAAAIYKYAVENDFIVVGASQNKDWTVTHKTASKVDELDQFKNSRYVFSEPYIVYGEVKMLLKEGKKIIMVGLPCQIAAMRKLFPNNSNLILIDIVCHGIMPVSYLQQHIATLEETIHQKAERMSFRAPEKGTANYFFTLYNKEGDIIYSKRTVHGDLYNIAFHRSIAYRENCYHCHYAKPKRVSDITLGDYHGLGLLAPANYSANDVSVILVNTKQGQELIDSVSQSGLVHLDCRPTEEPLQGDAQLRRPSSKSKERKDFEELIVKNKGNFEKTMSKVLKRSINRGKREKIMSIPRRIVRKILRLVTNR